MAIKTNRNKSKKCLSTESNHNELGKFEYFKNAFEYKYRLIIGISTRVLSTSEYVKIGAQIQ